MQAAALRFIILTGLLVLTFAAPAAGLRDHAWQLHHPDWARMEATIRRAPEFGVTEIELSHEIITTVDQIVEEPAVRELVQKTIALCDELHLKVYVWAKELNIGSHVINTDLDPNGGGMEMWAKRRAAYRNAFALCPGLAGVVLQFGSCPTEPWEISDGASAFNAATPCAERIKLIVNIVKEECDAAGKKLDVRDFNHSVAQQQCMRDAFQLVSGVRATTKEVPQDWQVYYPLNPMIGDVGSNDNRVEFDLGCEYWGCSKVPFAMVDYLSWRMRAMAAKGITGVVVRVERGDDPALGTPNEINLYAMARLVQDPQTPPDTIYSDWMQKRYGLAPGSAASKALIAAFRDSFDAGRKTFYVLNHWALEKSSQIPDAVQAECLYFKALPQWDADYKASWQELTQPNAKLLLKMRQEKLEAVVLAQQALTRLDTAKPMVAPGDFDVLYRQFSDLSDYAYIWMYVSDAVFRSMQWKKSDEDLQILASDANSLEAYAAAEGKNLPLASRKRLAAFVADLRKHFKSSFAPALPQANWISEIETERSGPTEAIVRFKTREPAVGHAEWGSKLPTLAHRADEAAPATDHAITITGLAPGARTYVRVGTAELVSGDYVVPGE